MMIGIVGYMFYNARKYRFGRHCNQYGPSYLVLTAAFFVMADISRHVLQDANVWPAGQWPGSSQYRSNCEVEDMACLSVVGWLFTIVFTYLGFTLLFIGTMWNANICKKIKEFREKWNELRTEHAAAEAAAAAATTGPAEAV